MTALIACAVLWAFAVIGVDRCICWLGEWLERRARWERIRRDMARTVERIRNQRTKELSR